MSDPYTKQAIRELAVAIEMLASSSVHEIGTNRVGEIHAQTAIAVRTAEEAPDGVDD